jgi:hypothetical protein
MAFIVVTFISKFVKISPLVRNLKVEGAQRGEIKSNNFIKNGNKTNVAYRPLLHFA